MSAATPAPRIHRTGEVLSNVTIEGRFLMCEKTGKSMRSSPATCAYATLQ
jgi:hypothetical protein